MEDKRLIPENQATNVNERAISKLSIKEKRLDQRRKIEELMEKKRLRQYTESYDYYFCE